MSRPLLLAALIAALLLLLFTAEAKAGTYTVRQCAHAAPVNEAHEGLPQSSPPAGPYVVQADPNICASSAADYAINIGVTRDALAGEYGIVRWLAPIGTKFTGVHVDAKLRTEQGHRARLSMASAAGVEQARVAVGDPGPATFTHYDWPPAPRPGFDQFTVSLVCDDEPNDCPVSIFGGQSTASIRNLKLDVTDSVAPTTDVSGPLVAGGWIRGVAAVGYEAVDIGGGVRFAPLGANGVTLANKAVQTCDLIAGTEQARTLAPCPGRSAGTTQIDTTAAPFVDGDNALFFCAQDFGLPANFGCARKTVRVDNAAPRLTFRDQQAPSDPELIVADAVDQTSGLDAASASIEFAPVGDDDWQPLPTHLIDGELWTRVDSVHSAPGAYKFRATILDVAGNQTATTARADGRPMVLSFPLKEAASLDASLDGARSEVVPFRKPGEVRGRLLDADGDPIAGARVTVTETFAPGSLIDERIETATTNAQGRYASTLPGGPSREVGVSYGGSTRFQPDHTSGLNFQVRTDATLRTSKRRVKAGDAVSFLGRVKRYYAAIPPGGKLVEVQVKSGDDWTTIHQAATTNEKGKVELRHRFRRFYTQRVTFTFRLKVTGEADWPYVGGSTSHKRKVTVVPR